MEIFIADRRTGEFLFVGRSPAGIAFWGQGFFIP